MKQNTSATAAAPAPSATVVELTQREEKKHVVLFKTADPNAAMSSAYISRSMPGIANAKGVRLTIEVLQ